jgi:hypothetical protein
MTSARQAGAVSIVTPSMVERGAEMLMTWDQEWESPQALVRRLLEEVCRDISQTYLTLEQVSPDYSEERKCSRSNHKPHLG